MSPCPHVSVSPSLRVPMSPCLPLSVSACLHVSVSPCLRVSVSPCPSLEAMKGVEPLSTGLQDRRSGNQLSYIAKTGGGMKAQDEEDAESRRHGDGGHLT